MAGRNYDRRGQQRAHAYHYDQLSQPRRHAQSDVEHATATGSSYVSRKSDGRTCRSQYDTLDLPVVKRRVFRCIVWFGLIAAVCFLGYNMAYQILAVVKGSEHTDVSTPEFTLYKNSQFASCVQRTPQRAVNCTLLEANLNSPRYPDLDWIGQQDRHHFMSGPGYQITNDARDPRPSWCDMASCLAEWKVIPSTPRDSALGLTALKAWMHLLITAVVVLWTINKMLSLPETCNRHNPIDWSLLIWQVGELGLWWWAFGTLVSNPDVAEPVSLVGWVSTWNMATSFRFHPWSCFFDRDSKTRRGIIIGLNVLTFIQWAATIHALRLQDSRDSMQKYDCLDSGIASAPGSSVCSDERLCSTTWLFQNPDFMSEDNETSLVFYKVAVYYQIVIYPLIAGAEAFDLLIFKGGSQKAFQFCRLFLFLFGGYLGIVYAIPYFISSDPKLPTEAVGGLATVAYDFGCRAIHIGISPTYSYLDMDAFARSLRIVRMWFNA
ncbi:hypothetical protein CDV36_015418 [Fusarium kuroshium]|uniref:Uncharacterized protein n=2 Tax=Fusarium solani species complex TaxID=232080 RepID=A0A3M2RB08_9HYPO|nr:hypothetical protein CDV36_015418 [Fusarium kuroshium]RSL82571.1 hypothetical protein CEP52_016928 [Fusarium oligoseptatum]